jgi:universal stress protein E
MGKLLVVADQGDTCTAIERGLKLGRRLGHSVEVVAFVHAPLKRLAGAGVDHVSIKQKVLDRRTAQVEAIIAKFAEEGQKAALKVVWLKDIHPWIIKRAASGKFDAVIKTSRQTGSLGYTSTDWHLLRECTSPVLIAAENKWHRTKPILAALDLGTRSRRKRELNFDVLAHAVQLAEALRVELRIISAIEVPTLLADLDLVDPISYTREHRKAMLPHIRKLAEAHDLPEKAFRTKRGPVAKVITSEAASSRAQLVVMGTVGRSGLKARVIGNTAEEVLRHLRTDVLAIKPRH